MSIRVSYGSRAGGPNDYHGGLRNPQAPFGSRGPFDSVDELRDAIRAEIDAAAQSAVPNCTTVELHFSANATLPLHRPTIGPYSEGGAQDLPVEFKTTTTREDGTTISDPFPTARVSDIIAVANSRDRQIVQRAASRGVLSAVEAADGYRYSFNNAWNAKDEEGSRFSYICQDSMQNKDRHANGFTRTLKHLKSENERGPRKPTYDCKGSVSVKFSTTRQSVDVYYRHYAIHSTVAERKPAPRPPPKPRQSLPPKETGGLAAALQAESMQAEKYASSALRELSNQYKSNDSPLAAKSQGPNTTGSLKRKRDWEPRPTPPPRNPNQPLSLVELLQQSETANSSLAADSQTSTSHRIGMPPPVKYELPSWQTPPPTLNGGHPAPYPPPYNPGQKSLAKARHSTGTMQPSPIATPASRPSEPCPKPQGLFTTMKPVVSKEWVVQSVRTLKAYPPGTLAAPMHPNYNTFPGTSRAKTSCTNCRYAKRKCDEGKPCGACAKTGRTDCMYEVAAGTLGAQPQPPQQLPTPTPTQQESTPWQTPQNSGSWGSVSQPAPPPSAQHSEAPSASAANREDSPDPWFPKR